MVVVVFIGAVPVSGKWYFPVVLTCIALMTHDAEHLFMCLLAIRVSFLREIPIQILFPFEKLDGLLHILDTHITHPYPY